MALTSASTTTEVIAPGDAVAATSATKDLRRGKRASPSEGDGTRAGLAKREPRRAAAQKGGRGANPAHSVETKASVVLKKLGSPKGVTIESLMEATGWQAHSVRGFLSAVVKKKLGHNLVNEIGKDGFRRYRIDGTAKSK
jgi:Protein of unknown function (DUF3489)